MRGRSRRSDRNDATDTARSAPSVRSRSSSRTLLVGLVLDARGARDLFLIFVPALLLTMVVTATIRAARRHAARSTSCAARERSSLTRVSRCSSSGSRRSGRPLRRSTRSTRSRSSPSAANTALVGIAWAVGAAIEVPLMYSFPRLAARFGTERLLVLGHRLVRPSGAPGRGRVGPDVLVLDRAARRSRVFALVFVGGVTVLAARAPAGMGGTAQGLFSASARPRHDHRLVRRWRDRRRPGDRRAVRGLCRRRLHRHDRGRCRAPAPESRPSAPNRSAA